MSNPLNNENDPLLGKDDMEIDVKSPSLPQIDTSMGSPSDTTSMGSPMSSTPTPSSADLPKGTLAPKSPTRLMPDGKIVMSSEINKMNNQLQDATQKLATTFANYKKVMGIYGDGYEVSIQLATQLAKKLLQMKNQVSITQKKLEDKSAELQKIDELQKQLVAKTAEYEAERKKLIDQSASITSEANAQVKGLNDQIKMLKATEAQLRNELSGHKEMSTKERQEKERSCGMLNKEVDRLNKEHDDVIKLLRTTFARVDALDKMIVENMNALSTDEAVSRKRKARVLNEYRVEFKNLTDQMGEIKELSKLYNDLLEKGVPQPRAV